MKTVWQTIIYDQTIIMANYYYYDYTCWQYSSLREGCNCSGGEIFFYRWYFQKEHEYAKLMVEPYICDNLNHIYRFFWLN